MKEKESDKAHRIAISKHFPVSYYGVSMAPSGPRTIAQVCTLEYCHPANGNKGPKQDNPQRESMGLGGKVAIEEEKGSCGMLIELHPLIEVERVPIVPLSRSSAE
ncbi:proline-rich membrane anchor 1 isoform X1 [Lates japonicus]|uniref:Proline-rich membrane anchor 1 isoform X1 n=1 Tax=Lates japonicus TaxID=270547 RepID=A0AAD3MWE8_LATJO|nr:proline-rich membrane anchor 1 isoform X1 [Lates japonicus]